MILITNDDGLESEGFKVLESCISDIDEVWIVAPEHEISACSHAISLKRAIRVEEVGPRRFEVDGTTTDCVNLAINGILPERPRLLIAGINKGGNFGDDILYSGTCAAAIEATLLEVPSVAVSLDGDEGFWLAGYTARYIVRKVMERGLPDRVFLNVNVPCGELKGIKVTKLCRRIYGHPAVSVEDPRGMKFWFIGGKELEFIGDGQTDIEAVRNGYVSITPVKVKYDADEFADELRKWFE